MTFSLSEQERYSRHLLLSEVGEAGQQKLKSAKVLVVGAGGLGCPVLQYLAAAGVGTLGVMDFDIVAASNLQRQILFTESDIGKPKATCAAEKLMLLNPHILIKAINERLTVKNIRNVIEDFDIIVDGTDNFMTRYLINDGCVLSGKPFVFGSLYKFSGQVAVFNQLLPDGSRSANYRTVFPEPPVPGSVADCAETGVLGAVAGIVGTIQATETLKLILGVGNALAGKLLLIDTMKPEFNLIGIPPQKELPAGAPQTWEALELFDYEYFCSMKTATQLIDSKELEIMLASGKPLQVVDVREDWEYEETDGLHAISISLYELKDKINQFDTSAPIVVVCAEGKRSSLAVKVLQDSGFTNVMSLNGGLKAWNARQKV
jgi:molybdopterin/thiamine biosynthesis adenylyltransferase/rhodanese-related sulfurtransferase